MYSQVVSCLEHPISTTVDRLQVEYFHKRSRVIFVKPILARLCVKRGNYVWHTFFISIQQMALKLRDEPLCALLANSTILNGKSVMKSQNECTILTVTQVDVKTKQYHIAVFIRHTNALIPKLKNLYSSRWNHATKHFSPPCFALFSYSCCCFAFFVCIRSDVVVWLQHSLCSVKSSR